MAPLTGTAIAVERTEHVATITLARPDVYNALNFEMLAALRDLLAELRFETELRALIVTGAGDKAFCAGADLKERATMPPERVKQFIFTIRELMSDLASFPRPVIAAINGIALGGGTEMALGCDIRIASVNAVLGLTETSLAIIPGAGGTQRLPRLVGLGKAKELIFTARKVSAEEAQEIGLVDKLVPAGQAQVAAREMASAIAANGPLAVEMAKWAIDRGVETDLATGLALESRAYDLVIPTQDRLEGLAAFREKRRPVYRGV